MRRNIDAWWPLVAAGEIEAIVMNASACGLAVKEYGHALAHDAGYAEKAARISAATRDLSELLPQLAAALGDAAQPQPGASPFTRPARCSTGSSLRGGVEAHLRALGFDVETAGTESHLCCGSAGTYSVLQPELGDAAARPQAAASSTVGRRLHRVGQHRLHPAPAERHLDAGPALDRSAGRGACRGLSRGAISDLGA